VPENAIIAFIGDTKKGQFDIPSEVAQDMLMDKSNRMAVQTQM